MPSWRMVLGFDAGAEGGLDSARAMQLDDLRRARAPATAMNLAAVLVVALTLLPVAPAWPLVGWVVADALLCGLGLLRHGRRARAVEPADTRRTLVLATVRLAGNGAAWAFPLLYLAQWAGQGELMVLFAMVPALMAGSALVLPAAPLGAFMFSALVAVAGLGMAFEQGTAALVLALLVWTVPLLALGLAHARTLTRRRGLETALTERQAVVSLLLREFDEAADWLWQVDARRRLTSVSTRFARKLGREPEAVEGRPILEVLSGSDAAGLPPPLRALADRLYRRESFGRLTLPVSIAGETRWWSLSATPRHDEAGRFVGFWGSGSDVTEQRRAAEKIDHMARFDALTGIANRRQVLETLSEALVATHRDQRSAVFLIIDLDRFKEINDTLGHPIGDRLLVQVAERLTAICQGQGLCGRLGGDEFAVVLTRAPDDVEIDWLADQIIESLSAPYDIEDQRLFIGASVGSASAPRDGRSVEALVRSADLALYRAKSDGRSVHRRYEQQLSARADERRTIEVALREALEKGQFRLLYHPIVSAAGGRVEGFEALLRWTHPELGDVPPERFVPIAEEARLMSRIGEWVIRTACVEAARWPEPARLAINLSAEQLHQPQLVTTLVSALSYSGLAADRLELEIAEAIFLKRNAATAAILDRLHALGVRVALSGFGTGYASLGYLRGARFSTIKIDRSFIVGACANMSDSLAMVRAVVAMADSLGVSVTAEGTETEHEFAVARTLGCTQAQGYLFGQPLPPEEAAALAGTAAEREVA